MALPTGATLGPYEIQGRIGAGGMGEVYRARDTRLDRIVAIKVLPAHIASDPQLRERFDREARAISQLNNPHICALHDIGETAVAIAGSGQPAVETVSFLVLEYLQGQTLAERLESGPLPAAEALEIAVQIADGLKEAHRHDIVHRDLKPANIMLVGPLRAPRPGTPADPDQQRVVKLLDFGLAKVTTASRASTFGSAFATTQAAITTEGSILGTWQYMAPEQLKGLDASAAADVWALGCVLHEMLAGRDVRVRARITPARLNRLIDRCLEVDPGARPSTTDLARELRAIRGSVARRGRIVKACVAAAVLLLAVAGLFSVRWLRNKEPAPSKPVTVLIADFDNQTGETVFDGTVEHAISLALEDSKFVSTYPRQDAVASAHLIESNARLDERMARLVAQREGVSMVLAGVVAPEPAGYVISARLLDPQRGVIGATATERIPDRSKALAAIGRLGQELRRGLGERDLSRDSLPSDETFTTSSLDAAREYVIAQKLLGEGRLEEAVPHYRKALEHDPHMGRAYAGWSVGDYRLGKLDEARAHMAKALELLPRMNRREQLRTQGANFVGLAGDYQRAVETYETLLREYPAEATPLSNLSVARFMLLDFQAAKASGAEVVRVFPGTHLYRLNLALYSMYAGDFDMAVREANQAIALNPKSGGAYLPLAVNGAYHGNVAEARRWYDVMSKGDPRAQRLAAIATADLAAYAGDLQQARGVLTASIPADIAAGSTGSAATKRLMLAELALLAGDRDAAVAEATAAQSLVQSPQVLFRAAMIFLDAGKITEAAATTSQLPEQLQGPDLWYRVVADAELAFRRADTAAVSRLDQHLAKDRGTWLAHFRAGLLLLRARQPAAAAAHLTWCVEHRHEAAAAYLDDVPTIRYWSDAWYWSGVASEAAGNARGAKASYESFLAARATAHDPRTEEVRSRVAKLTNVAP